MKIYVLGSTTFMHDMIRVRDELIALGLEGWIHPDYDAYVRGEHNDRIQRAANGEHAAIKRENNYLHVHYQNILASDAVLIVNNEKRGIQNYVGGNALIEMGQAYVNHKKIFLLNGLPTDLSYAPEIECMDPICLNGDLTNITR